MVCIGLAVAINGLTTSLAAGYQNDSTATRCNQPVAVRNFGSVDARLRSARGHLSPYSGRPRHGRSTLTYGHAGGQTSHGQRVPIGDLSICSNARSIRSLVSAHNHHLRYNESEAAFAVLVRVLARTTTNNSAARASEQSVAQYCSVVPAMCQFAAAQERIIAETAMAD